MMVKFKLKVQVLVIMVENIITMEKIITVEVIMDPPTTNKVNLMMVSQIAKLNSKMLIRILKPAKIPKVPQTQIIIRIMKIHSLATEVKLNKIMPVKHLRIQQQIQLKFMEMEKHLKIPIIRMKMMKKMRILYQKKTVNRNRLNRNRKI